MKTFISIVFLFSCLIGCSEDSDILSPFEKISLRKIAFNSLNEPSKESLTEDWRLAKVTQGKYQFKNNVHWYVIDTDIRWSFMLNDPAYELFDNQLLVSVAFHVIGEPSTGPLVKIIDYKSKTVLGSVLRF